MTSSLQSRVEKFDQTVTNVDAWARGDANTSVDFGGGPVRSPAKLIADLDKSVNESVNAALNPDIQPVPESLDGTETWSFKKAGAWARARLSDIANFVLSVFTLTVGTATGIIGRTILAELLDLPVSVKRFGAKGNGVRLLDGAVSAGSKAFTSASASFTASDVGKAISVVGAGTGGAVLRTTISAFVSPTAVTLTAAASTAVTGAVATYGADDTTAVQNAVNYCAQPKRTLKLYFPSSIYYLGAEIVSLAPLLVSVVDPSPKNVGEADIGGGSWLFFAHSGKGFSALTTNGNYKGVTFRNIGTFRDQPPPASSWAPYDHDFDFYSDGADDVTYDNVLTANPTRAFCVNRTNNGRATFNVRGDPFKVGISVDRMYDVARFDVHFWSFWKDDPNLLAYKHANLIGILLAKTDNAMMGRIFVIHALSALKVTQSASGTVTKLSVDQMDADICANAITFDSSVNSSSASIGVLKFQSATPSIPGSRMIYVQGTGVQLNIGFANGVQMGREGLRVEGANNIVRVNEFRCQIYDTDGANVPAVYCASGVGNKVFIGGYPDIGAAGGTGGKYGGGGYISVDDWRAWTATPSTSSGVLGTVGAVSGLYKMLNNTVKAEFDVGITTNGTGAGAVLLNYPYGSPSANFIGIGKEKNLNGKAVLVDAGQGTGNIQLRFYDNSYPGADGCRLVGNVEYSISI
ncbi:pectin lyase activity [Burkholderia phage BcepMigl]|uniref:Pectin lyase-like protein n=1 Tax=Burkholderia phage BcepMigl TaxID=2886899 RepID=I6X6U1_9CAUD|nr:pectin lyase activity [Burkholderia phage BcepMigl]AFN39127.1 pectin lyase-like protein [Burkholderia phage BcepMigl]